MSQDCPECKRLWDEYSAATAEHVRLDNKLRLAALLRDRRQIESLTPEVEAAEGRRNYLREAIREHDAKAHGGQAATAQ